MKSWAGIAGYNLGTPSMASYSFFFNLKVRGARKPKCRSLPLVGMTSFICVAMLMRGFVGSAAAAAGWADPARELARKVAEITGPGAVAVEVGNRSSMSKADVAAVKLALEGELTASGVHLAARDRAA